MWVHSADARDVPAASQASPDAWSNSEPRRRRTAATAPAILPERADKLTPTPGSQRRKFLTTSCQGTLITVSQLLEAMSPSPVLPWHSSMAGPAIQSVVLVAATKQIVAGVSEQQITRLLAENLVIAWPTPYLVTSDSTREYVVSSVTSYDVGTSAASNIVGIHITVDGVVAAGTGGEHAGSHGRPSSGHYRVVPGTAVDAVDAASAVDEVVAGTAEHRVVVALAVHLVVIATSVQRVRTRAAEQDVVAAASPERVRPTLTVDPVITAAGIHLVVATAGTDRVVATARVDQIGTRRTEYHVVTGCRSFELVEVDGHGHAVAHRCVRHARDVADGGYLVVAYGIVAATDVGKRPGCRHRSDSSWH